LALLPIGGSFTRPVLVTHPPGDTTHLFVVEQNGKIWIVTKAGSGAGATYTKSAAPFLDVTDTTRSPSDGISGYQEERGLLGLAFHPDYATNGLFYIHHTADGTVSGALEGDAMIEEYHVSSDPAVADAASVRKVLYISHQDDKNHNGGQITFGSDGYLYIGMGDGGGADNQYGHAQTVDELLGNILRIDPTASGGNAYSSPTNNLKSVMSTALPEIWDYGFRNPYRFNFDGCTGDLYVGDVGQNTWEEIDIESAGDGRRNYGWSIMEGDQCHGGGGTCDETGLTLPVTTLPTSASSIVGGSVYRGAEIPGLRGTYLYGKTGGGAVYSFVYDGTSISTPVDQSDNVNPSTDSGRYTITSIQNGGDGELYFTDMANAATDAGHLLKLVVE
jgi:glucose/arabinose dehydrogenase